MFFNSTNFVLLFLPLSVVGYWFVPRRFKRLWLLAASLVFYVYAGLAPCLLLITMLVLTYLSARYLLTSQRWRGIGLVLSLSNLLPLVILKYSGLMFNTNASSSFTIATSSSTGFLTLALPLGISFYTFNLLGYSFDVYRKRVQPVTSLLEFATYITFFPTLISGPLVRYTNFNKQEQSAGFDLNGLEQGIFCFCMGLAKKVIIADTFATIVDPLFSRYTELGFVGAWLAAIAFSYQLYFDFSGYSDMAIGVGHMLGFKLPQNFDAPYTASSISEFWQRWHITLSTWFRDYVFTPFSRAVLKRDSNQHPALIRTASQLLTMALIGLWHGANWTYLVWGLYHGVLLAVQAQIRKPATKQWHTYTGRVITFLLVIIGWVLFRSPSVQAALRMYGAMIGLFGLGLRNASQILPTWSKMAVFLFVLAGFVLTNLSIEPWNLKWSRSWIYMMGISFLFVLCVILLNQPRPFLYFQY